MAWLSFTTRHARGATDLSEVTPSPLASSQLPRHFWQFDEVYLRINGSLRLGGTYGVPSIRVTLLREAASFSSRMSPGRSRQTMPILESLHSTARGHRHIDDRLTKTIRDTRIAPHLKPFPFRASMGTSRGSNARKHRFRHCERTSRQFC